ncbi:Fc.00g069620.m01.CDS01 [Cosmosporella sp. VM-42]
MRTTIACERCRKAKVKCKHTGSPPCQACLRSGSVDSCVLSGPAIHPRVIRSPRGAKRKRQLHAGDVIHQSVRKDGSPSAGPAGDLSQFFVSIPRQVVTKSLSIFRTQFPEYGFIHPSDLDFQPGQLSDSEMLKYMAIVAVSHRYMDSEASSFGSDCAARVAQGIQSRIHSLPCLNLIQAVLIMALHQWGDGEGYSAWMHAGIAVRITQGSLILSSSPQHSGTRSNSTAEPLTEPENRTIWTCFVVDRLLSCGRQRPALLKFEDMEIDLPSSEEEFALDISSSRAVPGSQFSFGHSFKIILLGLDIWSKIHGWVAEGGRKHAGMTEPEHCPWQPHSHWAQMKSRLNDWRDGQEISLKYPETKVSTHVHLRRGEVFVYINLIYYLSVVFLCREYIPFLPLGESGPRGPLDPPLLKDIAPVGFWEKNAAELFQATKYMTEMMRDLRRSDASIHTPFAGLCAFTSALMNLYAAAFPCMNGGSDPSASMSLVNGNMEDLKKICELWKLGEDWLDGVESARNLYSQVPVTRGSRLVRGSRDDYPELENSINLAQLKGMPVRRLSQASPTQAPETSVETSIPAPHRAEEPVNQPHHNSFFMPEEGGALQTGFDAGTMSDEGWRLWSFWDDPLLLSRFNNSDI